ncbi:hypothetical protein chiPu_0021459, partial [Chiloscyllium punctatum]|nr:hypothetical protein [Chiloscyllium punctatum]
MVLRIAVNDFTSLLPLSEKFGASLSECRQLMEYAKTLDLDTIGVSGCTDPKIYAQAIADARVVFDIGIHLGFQMYLLDIGGGFPGTAEDKVTFEEVAAEINPALDIYFPDKTEVQIIAEPGRIWGPTCDARDHISDAWMLPELEIGDWLLFKNNGAYTSSISTTFNGFHAAPTHYAISEEAWETLQNIKKEIQSPVEEQDDVDTQHLVIRQ